MNLGDVLTEYFNGAECFLTVWTRDGGGDVWCSVICASFSSTLFNHLNDVEELLRCPVIKDVINISVVCSLCFSV